MKISNETKVGAIAAISITILILGYNFLKGENLFTSYNRYYASYEDVEGLIKSNPVLINGYKVGMVNDVKMDPRTLKLLIEVKVPDNIKIPKESIIKIVNTDLIGSKGINVIMGTSRIIAKSGDTLKADKDEGMAKTVSKLIAPLSEKINYLLSEINQQIGDDQIKKTLINLNKTLVTFDAAAQSMESMIKGKDAKIDGILSNVQTLTGDLKSSTPKINSILANLDETTAELKKLELDATVKQLKTALADISQTIDNINKGQGTIGKLTSSDELYKNLDATVLKFKKLAEDIEKYPLRYTGFTLKQRGKGDKQKSKGDPN